MADKIGVGLIGFGMAARVFHAPLITSVPAFRLKKVVERHSDNSRERYPSTEVVRDTEAILQDEEIEMVVVATPNATHFDLARQSLLAGKHVVVEKPFTTTSNQADQLIDLARKQNRLISAHHNRRWDGDFLTVKKLLEEGIPGRLVEFESHYDRFRNRPRPNAWREEEGEGTGILFDLGSHLIDQAHVLFGVPKMITADLRAQREFARAIDSFELILHYADLKVTLKAGMLVRARLPRFILHGTAGSFVKYGMDPQEEALKHGRSPLEPGWGEEPHEQWGTLSVDVDGLPVESKVETIAGNYVSYYQNVADSIAGRAELLVKPEQARNTIRAIEIAIQSNDQKCSIAFSQ
jgi:scyllo-inositol 2-dehydrogenase (NADP+)